MNTPTQRRKPFAEMTPDEARLWIRTTRAALQEKMRRERDYLDSRKRRRVHTGTDDAYERDQLLEADIVALLDEMEAALEDMT